MIDYDTRVARGAALLDEKLPGWWQRVDLDRLDLSKCTDCVLGQLTGDYDSMATTLLIGPRANKYPLRGNAKAARLGFTLPPSDAEWLSPMRLAEWAALTAAWKRLIESRRSQS